jgi:hypothetical protein
MTVTKTPRRYRLIAVRTLWGKLILGLALLLFVGYATVRAIAGLMAVIRVRVTRRTDRHPPGHREPRPATDSDGTSGHGSVNAVATTATPDAARENPTDSADGATAEERSKRERHWEWLARRRHLPPFIRKHIQHRRAVADAQAAERHWRRRDPDDNRDTRIPDGEQVRIPVIWLTELYTPTTLSGLLKGLPPLITKARWKHPERGDLVEWVQAARRQGGGAWQMLPEVWPPGTRYLTDQIVDDLPTGISSVTWGIYTLTSTVTAVTAAFHVREEYAEELQRIINQDVSTHATLTPGGGFKISDVRWQKQEAADRWRESLRSAAAEWLAERLPGSFHGLAPCQPPTIELLLTEKQRPWDTPISDVPGSREWMRLLDLVNVEGYWQSTDMRWLRLRERQILRWNPSLKHIQTLAALRSDFLAIAAHGTLGEAIYLLHQYITPFASRQALTALLNELDEQVAAIRDLSERATSQRSPKALNQVQRQLIHTGLDSQIVATDIARFARNERWWTHDVLDFIEVLPSALSVWQSPRESLSGLMRQRQVDRGAASAQAEADLREVINSSAQLTAATENIRLQRSVRWLAIISVIVAIIATAATVAALYISSRTPSPTPVTHTSPTQTLSGKLRLW